VKKLLEVEDLSTHFYTSDGVIKAVDGVTWDVMPGETVAIVGESGSGKSVTALSIMRLIMSPPGRIVSGRVEFDGRDLLALPDEAMRNVRGRDIGMVFQEPMTSLNPVLTIGLQLTETLQQHLSLTPAQAYARAEELLAMVGIADPKRRLRQYPHHFSGGMRQRVMIAMALACEPKLIIADEPTTALDVTIQAQILELMKDLTRRLGAALIIITHNLGVVARYADRVNVMYAGRIVERGRAHDIYYRPRHPYTRALLRSVPRMDRPRGGRLDPIAGQPPDLARLPAGCSFRPRCRYAQPRCEQEAPVLELAGDEQYSACWEKSRLAEPEAAETSA
jgi:oligopeptide/dipeptide ABC transporter ATP-binding protein